MCGSTACRSKRRSRFSRTGIRSQFPIRSIRSVKSGGLPSVGRFAAICSSCLTPNAAITFESSVLGTQMHVSENNMRAKNERSKSKPEVPDYDFSTGVRGKYAARYAAGTNVVVLSPDVAEVFPDSEAVNEALRTLVRISGKSVRIKSPRKKRAG